MPFPRRSRSTIVDNSRTIRNANFGGIDVSSSNDTISEFNTPDCLNMLPNNKGDITTRFGIKTVHDYSNEKILATFNYKAGAIIVTDVGIYDSNIDYTTSKITGTVEGPFSGFEYNSRFYLLTKNRYLQYSEPGVFTDVAGYIPTVRIKTPSTGGGLELEEENMIQNLSYQEFQFVTGDTFAQFFKTNLSNDVNDYSVWYRNLTTGEWDLKTLTTDYTVDFTTGKFTYVTNPPESINFDGNDTVRIKAGLATPIVGFGDELTIRQCTLSAIYGGKTNISVWMSGNPDYPNFDFHSGIHDGKSDPTYFPLTEFDEIGFDDQAIIAYQNQNNELIIYKNNPLTKKESTWVRGTNIVGDEVVFYKQELNPYMGCIARNSAVLINNSSWALGRNGYGKVVPKQVLAENSIETQSDLINYNKNVNFSTLSGLLEAFVNGDSYLEDYVSIDFKNKLYVSNPITNQVWVCDYNNVALDQASGKYLPQWYLLNNVAATCWVVIDNQLYFGTRGSAFARFKTFDDVSPCKDEQEGNNEYPVLPDEFDFYWSTKLNNLGTLQYKEDVESIYIAMQGYADTQLNIWTRSDIDSIYALKDTHEIKSLVYSTLIYSSFVYGGTLFPKAFKSKVKVKNAEYVQVKIGGTTGLPATLTNVEMNVSEGKEI